jgi:DNA-binding response OmpR family regulator
MPEGKYVILCVDDDPDVLASLKIVLNAGGYSVLTAADSAAGLSTFRDSKPDLVILDLMMEDVDDGTILLKKMREIDSSKPIYMLSSTGDYLYGSLDANEIGLAGVLQKPVNPNVLLGLLRAKLKG